MQSISNYREEFAQVAARLPGTNIKWLRELRLSALENFEAVGFPGPREEDWKYTNISPIARRAFHFAANETSSRNFASSLLDMEEADRLVFIDGRHAPSLSHVRSLPLGAIVTNMATALTAHLCQMQETLIADHVNGFAALNAAFWSDGAYIALSKDIVLQQPIHLVFICTEANLACMTRNVIHLGTNSSLLVIEHYVDANGDTSFTNAVTHIDCEDGARAEHYKVQEESPHAFHIGNIDVRQENRSSFHSHSFAFGAQLSRTDIATRFLGEGCHAEMNGLYVANERQHVDHHTRIDHVQPRGTSREHYKGVLDGAAHGVFNGKVIVHENAQLSDALQSNRNLLLSNDAEIDTKPQLEIYADNVKCNHGATVGQLDENQIFYLRSRGIELEAARSALTFAFAEEVIEQVAIQNLRQHLEQSLRRKLTSRETK